MGGLAVEKQQKMNRKAHTVWLDEALFEKYSSLYYELFYVPLRKHLSDELHRMILARVHHLEKTKAGFTKAGENVS